MVKKSKCRPSIFVITHPSKVPGKESNLTFVIAAGITNGVVELALLLIAASSRTDNEHVIKMDVKVVEIQPGKRPFMDLIVRDILGFTSWRDRNMADKYEHM